MEGQKTELKIIRMSEVESQEVKWLWYPFIPYGKLTIIQGDPGDGKTTLVLNIAAKDGLKKERIIEKRRIICGRLLKRMRQFQNLIL